ncbi:MAG: KEOPS complex subunit Pcc1 [Candidatus Hodarchaeales archaeon]|jgi:KEOPS complex subunit Pcc1
MNAPKEENNWPIVTSVRIKLRSPHIAEIISQALNPEIATQLERRARADIEQEGVNLSLKISAKDQIALRATMNSFLRWIDGALSTLELV